MAKDPRFGRRLSVVVVTLLTALLAGAGELRAQALSCRTSVGLPVVPFLGLVTSNPISCTVNCAAGGTIASAVAMKPQTTNTLTITINGTCVESVDDVPSGVTLQAASSGATLQAPSSTTDPVLGVSGIGVTLNNLTISGGVYALRGHSGAAFTGNNLVIEGASAADVLLNHAVVTLNTSTIENSANDGIDASWGSTVFLNGGVVQGNAGYGANFGQDASLDVFGGAVLQKNGVAGAQAFEGGAVDISDGIVENNATATGGVAGLLTGHGGHLLLTGSGTSVVSNGGDGILVQGSGTAELDTNPVVANNALHGIELHNGGSVKVQIGAVIEGNGGNGIYIESGSLQVGDLNGPATIKNNKQNGIFMRTNSVASFRNSGNQIINNTGWGILCTGSPSNPLIYAEIGTFGTVSGNGLGNISCNVSP